jgi:nicotinamidase-related amidase
MNSQIAAVALVAATALGCAVVGSNGTASAESTAPVGTAAMVAAAPAGTPAAPAGATELLTPNNCALALIDFQPQMFFGVQSHDRQTIQNNVVGLTKAAQVFKVPTILSTVETESFSGPTFKALTDAIPNNKPIERSSMNSWEDEKFVAAVKATGKKKLIIAGLWTEVCVVLPTLEALRDGYQVYVVTDACGGTTPEAHERAIQRVTQAGAIPVTWQQVMLEWQRDWSRKESYAGVTTVIQEHSGAYGLGVFYVASKAQKSAKH